MISPTCPGGHQRRVRPKALKYPSAPILNKVWVKVSCGAWVKSKVPRKKKVNIRFQAALAWCSSCTPPDPSAAGTFWYEGCLFSTLHDWHIIVMYVSLRKRIQRNPEFYLRSSQSQASNPTCPGKTHTQLTTAPPERASEVNHTSTQILNCSTSG